MACGCVLWTECTVLINYGPGYPWANCSGGSESGGERVGPVLPSRTFREAVIGGFTSDSRVSVVMCAVITLGNYCRITVAHEAERASHREALDPSCTRSSVSES
jgi:hypothetical protein